MEQSYAYAVPQGTGQSALLPLQGSGVARVIVDSRFCASYPVEMAIVRELTTLTDGNFGITDVKGNLLFKVKEPVIGIHGKRILLDGSGSPVLTLKNKIMSMHSRWQVFRGGSTESRDLLYTVKQSSMFQLKPKLDVFLSHNEEEERCDFRVKGGWIDNSSVVYSGESAPILAQMQTVHNVDFWGLDNFYVKVNPNVDYAFIASLIVIFDAIYRPPPKPKLMQIFEL